MSRKRSHHSQKAEYIQDKMARNIDELSELKDFKENVLPHLRQAVRDNKSVKTIYKMAEPYVAARVVTMALTEPDNGKALAALKDILDRGDGKATERKEIVVSDRTSDAELAAILEATEQALDEDETTPH